MSTDEIMTDSSYRVYANRYFVIEQCRDCAVPGYLIVSSRQEAVYLSELSGEALNVLGPTLALAVAVVRHVIEPVKIYCAQFGEEASQLHFHVFPRTKEITEEYLTERPEQAKLIHGPVLLDWARDRYKSAQGSRQVNDAIERIRRWCSIRMNAIGEQAETVRD